MRWFAVVLVVGCSSPATPREAPTAPREAPPVIANQSPPVAPTPPCAAIAGEDARALAAKKDTHPIDLDGDPATEELLVENGCSGLRCTYNVYAYRADCWSYLGATRDLMSEPGCERNAAKGTYCTLSGMRLMIHGDAQEYLFSFDGKYGEEQYGTRYVPGREK